MIFLGKINKKQSFNAKVHLTIEQSVFVVKQYCKSSSYVAVKKAFRRRIWRNVKNTKEKKQV